MAGGLPTAGTWRTAFPHPDRTAPDEFPEDSVYLLLSGGQGQAVSLRKCCSVAAGFILTFGHLRRRASQSISYRQEMTGGNSKV
jgi:hypothetical protein